jgi:hypothetical protein
MQPLESKSSHAHLFAGAALGALVIVIVAEKFTMRFSAWMRGARAFGRARGRDNAKRISTMLLTITAGNNQFILFLFIFGAFR